MDREIILISDLQTPDLYPNVAQLSMHTCIRYPDTIFCMEPSPDVLVFSRFQPQKLMRRKRAMTHPKQTPPHPPHVRSRYGRD